MSCMSFVDTLSLQNTNKKVERKHEQTIQHYHYYHSYHAATFILSWWYITVPPRGQKALHLLLIPIQGCSFCKRYVRTSFHGQSYGHFVRSTNRICVTLRFDTVVTNLPRIFCEVQIVFWFMASHLCSICTTLYKSYFCWGTQRIHRR